MSSEALRRQYRSELEQEKARITRMVAKDKEAIEYLEGTEFTEKLSRLQQKVLERQERLSVIDKEIKDVILGRLDEELGEKQSQEEKIIREKGQFTKQKKLDKRIEKEASMARLKARPNLHREENRKGRDLKYHYKRFCQVGDDLPDFISRNLADMPGNKGYIWKGMWFFGRKRPERGEPDIMFEKLKGGLLRIHEYRTNEYRLYEKKGKEKRRLIKKKMLSRYATPR